MTAFGDEWGPCPEGEVAGLVEQLSEKRRHETMRHRSLLGAGFLAVLFVGVFGLRALNPPAPVLGISCGELRQYTQQILANTLSGPLGERIRVHLVECDHCSDYIERARADSAKNAGGEMAVALR